MDKKIFTVKNLQVVNQWKIYKGGNKMTTALKIKPIKATPAVEGKFAKDIIKEALCRPSKSAVKRNIAASELVRKLRG